MIDQGHKGNFAWPGGEGQRSRVTLSTKLVMINLGIIFNYERDIYTQCCIKGKF